MVQQVGKEHLPLAAHVLKFHLEGCPAIGGMEIVPHEHKVVVAGAHMLQLKPAAL